MGEADENHVASSGSRGDGGAGPFGDEAPFVSLAGVPLEISSASPTELLAVLPEGSRRNGRGQRLVQMRQPQ